MSILIGKYFLNPYHRLLTYFEPVEYLGEMEFYDQYTLFSFKIKGIQEPHHVIRLNKDDIILVKGEEEVMQLTDPKQLADYITMTL